MGCGVAAKLPVKPTVPNQPESSDDILEACFHSGNALATFGMELFGEPFVTWTLTAALVNRAPVMMWKQGNQVNDIVATAQHASDEPELAVEGTTGRINTARSTLSL